MDPSTGRASSFVATGVPFQSVGLEFDVHSGLLYGATRYELYTVDPSSGATSYVGPLGGSNIDDLAWHPTCN